MLAKIKIKLSYIILVIVSAAAAGLGSFHFTFSVIVHLILKYTFPWLTLNILSIDYLRFHFLDGLLVNGLTGTIFA